MSLPVRVKGVQTNLTESDFVAEGGEGKVYKQGDVVFKIYHDPQKMVPLKKIEELRVLDDPRIIRPEEIVYSGRNQPIGYTMRAVMDTVQFAKLFTTDFQGRHGITMQTVLDLVVATQEAIASVHKHSGYAVVDGNELNLLADKATFTKPAVIDVDSFKTPSFPATVLMPSIRDWSVEPGEFSPLSDWFSFAVIVTQLFVGMHPYKGTHPDYGKRDLEGRMRGNASIFGGNVRMPAAARPIANIPETYRSWLIAVLEEGQRLPPPHIGAGSAIVQQIAPVVQELVGSKVLDVKLLKEFESNVLATLSAFGLDAYLTALKVSVGSTVRTRDGFQHLAFTPKGTFLAAKIENGKPTAMEVVSGKKVTMPLAAEEMMSYEGRLYVKSGARVTEVKCLEPGGNVLIAPGNRWDVLPHATHMFPGVVIQNVLGKPHVSVFPDSGKCHQFYLPELEGSKVVDAKYSRGVLVVLCHKDNAYHELLVRVREEGQSLKYDTRWTNDIDLTSIQFIVLTNGVAIRLVNEKLEIFSNMKGSPDLKEVTDPLFENVDVKLHTDGQRVLLSVGPKLYKISMRS